MRVTNKTLVNNYLSSLNKSLERQSDLQEKLADEKDIHRPSDNPVKAIRALRFRTSLNSNEQFQQNAQDALSWMETTDGVMSDLSSIMARAKELTVSAISSNTPESFKAIGAEIDGLIKQAVQLGNTQIGDRYVFAGQMDKTQPLKYDSGRFVYLGDNRKISMVVQPGAANPDRDSVNLTGMEIFGPSMDMLRNLKDIQDQLNSGNPDLQYLSNTGLGNIEKDHDRLLYQQTQLGGRMSMYEMAKSLLSDDNVTITDGLSKNEDLDVPKALMDFKTSENVYNAALAVGAKVLPVSLVDFLK